MVSILDIHTQLGIMSCRHLIETVPMSLSRMMLIFEYLLRNFFDPPAELMEQVISEFIGIFCIEIFDV